MAIFERTSDEHLVVPHTVEITGIDEIDSVIERGVDSFNALGLVRVAVHAGHAHSAEGQWKDAWTSGAELPSFIDSLCRHDNLLLTINTRGYPQCRFGFITRDARFFVQWSERNCDCIALRSGWMTRED